MYFGQQLIWDDAQECVLLGKPAPVIYQAAMQLLGLHDPKDVIAIGDSLEHDIAGASSTSPSSLLCNEFGLMRPCSCATACGDIV